jgi:hypothetical protein
MPAALVKSTTQLGLGKEATNLGAGAFSAAAAKLAEETSRRLLMVKLISIGAASLAAIAVSLTTASALRPSVGAQVPPAPGQVAPKGASVPEPLDDFRFMNDPARKKDFLYAELGGMLPLIETVRGPAFQSREAIRYKDGTAKLWSGAQKDPVAILRHKGPIRDLTFFEESKLLITLSDESVKVWVALTGEPRKELERQTISPMWLSFAPNARRFVTIDSDHKVVTVWDAVTLAAVAILRTAGGDQVVESAGLSEDGMTVVMFRFRPGPSAELWDVASGRPFATLRRPSSALEEVLAEGGKSLNRATLQQSKTALAGGVFTSSRRGTRFWEVVKSLAPKAGERKD